MKATIVTMTRELAKDYLSRNHQNRKVNNSSLNFYKQQMINGSWKENGEPIIIDSDGVIKDGQHRLLAVKETGIPYTVPVISQVSTDVMDTIDTGKNRSASDVLQIEGFKYSTLLAASIKSILLGKLSVSSSHTRQISNSDILNFAKDYKNYLYELVNKALSISSLQVSRVLSDSQIVFYLYKYNPTEKTELFLQSILGIKRNPKSATDYVYRKLYKSSIGDIRLSIGDKQKYITKAYEYFIKGDNEVKYIKINVKKQIQIDDRRY
tara:strand:- start:254 stop:1051 length:798 start_codon:yes stop_codon:yes gene_type:complete